MSGNFGISTHNYLEVGILSTSNNYIDYGYIPESGGSTSIVLANNTGRSIPVGCILLGNIYASTGDVSIGIGGVSNTYHIASTKKYLSPYQINNVSTNVLKFIPALISPTKADRLSISNGDTLTITCNVPIGYLWIGDFVNLDIGTVKPTNVSLISEYETIELQNGDRLREYTSTARELNISVENASDSDRNFLSSNIVNGDNYVISGFNPFASKYCNPYSDIYTEEEINKWMEFTALTVMNSPLAITPKIYNLYSYRLKFREKV